MKEIGGYIELDKYSLPMLHEGAVAINCGRNALAYLLKAKNIKKLYIPRLICDSVTGVCEREGVVYELYHIGMDLLPSEDIELGEGEWFYFINYYSLFNNDTIAGYVKKYQRVIIDNAQSYFQTPLSGVDTIYTCRKYFGVADGAFLYTDAAIDKELPLDVSFERMHFLLGRFERSASEFYSEYSDNNKFFANEPIKKMSKLTDNLLRAIDYEQVKNRREENYAYLHEVLKELNLLELKDVKGTFMYPFMIKNGAKLRKQLQEEKIYIPVLWPNVLRDNDSGSAEYRLADDVLPLPIDQRYGREDMDHIISKIKEFL